MSKPRRSIFREGALRNYAQKRERDILPYVVAPPVFAYSWLLLALLLLLAVLTWSLEIPTYVSAAGTVLAQGQAGANEAVVFFPNNLASQLRVGMPVQIQVGNTGPHVDSTIARIDATAISPGDARKRYGLDGGSAQTIREPSTAVIVQLGAAVPARSFAGSTVNAQVQIGTRSVISQFFNQSARTIQNQDRFALTTQHSGANLTLGGL